MPHPFRALAVLSASTRRCFSGRTRRCDRHRPRQISRDIGVRLTRRTLTTHAIDPDVDETRWYLLQDLFFSEALERFGLVAGVGAAPQDRPRHNYTGDPYFTDGRRAVLWLTSRPVSYHHVATRWPAPRQKQPGLRACPDLNLHC